jgi:hypothetical protein
MMFMEGTIMMFMEGTGTPISALEETMAAAVSAMSLRA